MDRETLRRDISAVPFWFHSIDLDDGLVTPGSKKRHDLRKEFASLRRPDLRGKSVIDIGAWDRFYSFAAEAMGTCRVVALDHFVWRLERLAKRESMDIERLGDFDVSLYLGPSTTCGIRLWR